jgi:hypothetical protein
MSIQNMKPCAHCGKLFGPSDMKWPRNFPRQQTCSRACMRAAKSHTPEQVVAAFWAKVDKAGAGGCWIWTASIKPRNGYGHARINNKDYNAHRWAYENCIGPIPDGMEVMHTCDVPACVNPAHLRLGTHQENMADAFAKKRHAWGERNTHAVLTEEQVRQIRREFKFISPKRTNARELAKKYGFRRGTIYLAATGRTWIHLK